jgi:nucleotide-binding universal stress UspA family protein
MPQVQLPNVPGWNWTKEIRSGDVIDVISETAAEINAGLIVLTTDGRNGFLDALRGSHSERIMQRAPCPLLAIPAGGFIASVI